jgi:phosphoglycolate phosphatase-like HAD superfamily hydrolase
MPAVVLFDIDGTLVLTGGAGMRAMGRAFHDLFSIADAFDGVSMPGRTDTLILADAVRRAGVAPGDPPARFRATTFRLHETARPPLQAGHAGRRALLDAWPRGAMSSSGC